MRNLLILALTFLSLSVFAVEGLNQGVSLKNFSRIDCSAGLSCSKVKDKFTISQTGGLHSQVLATATTITSSQCGSTFYNAGAIQMTLPVAANVLGCKLTFVTMNASTFGVDPNGTDQILALTDAAGDKITNGTAGNSVTLQAMAAGKWAANAIYGTWADAN